MGCVVFRMWCEEYFSFIQNTCYLSIRLWLCAHTRVKGQQLGQQQAKRSELANTNRCCRAPAATQQESHDLSSDITVGVGVLAMFSIKTPQGHLEQRPPPPPGRTQINCRSTPVISVFSLFRPKLKDPSLSHKVEEQKCDICNKNDSPSFSPLTN